jgi:deazaflavin-dependent oxidoreductase (nitroreductase family)
MLKLAQPFFRRQVDRYRKLTTEEPGKFMGFPVLLLTTVGARSGKEHTHVLGGFPDGHNAWLVIASNSGAAIHPRWFHNLAKQPDRVWAQVGNRRFKAHVVSLQGADREAAYARVVKAAPNYGGYLKKTDREIPVLRITPES